MKKTIVEKHFDNVAKSYDKGKIRYSLYYSNLKRLLSELILPNRSVFEFGCGTGSLLGHLKPSTGYGMDISSEMIAIAKNKYINNKNLKFSTVWPHKKFDYIFMSDVIEHLQNPHIEFNKLANLMTGKSKLIITMANPVWEPILMLWEKLGLKMPEGPHNRLTATDLKLIINSSNLKILKHDYRLLVPIEIPLITSFGNKYMERSFKRFAFIEYFVVSKA